MKNTLKNLNGEMFGALGLLALLFLFSGCAQSESAAIATSEMVATYELKGDGGRLECNATFNVGGTFGTYLELTGDDEAWCGDGERAVKLKKLDSFLGAVSYTGGSELRYEPGRTYTFTFKRTAANTFNSTVILPEPVTITAPTPNNLYKKGGTLYTVWNAGSGSLIDILLSWRHQSETHSQRVESRDTGTYVFSAFDTNLQNAKGDVPTSVTVTRINRGSHTSGLKGGSISAKQSQTVSFTFVD
jgi:hypothetical protein